MKSIILIIPYFGKWPIWFKANLVSVAGNPSINWLCPTNCKIPDAYPDNIKFVSMELDELNEKVNEIVSAKVPLNPRKFCDLKPAYGHIFAEYLHGYDFWGFCDLDIIWGDIRKFVTDDILENFDIISSRKENLAGHFSIFRNMEAINLLYQAIPRYKEMLLLDELQRIDEEAFTVCLKSIKLSANLNIWWDNYLLNQINGIAHQEYYLDRWMWKDGKMYEIIKGKVVKEVMYLHFINWKQTLRYSEIHYKDRPLSFYISYSSMHYQLHSSVAKTINHLKNLVGGYWVKEKRRKRKIRYNRFKKRLLQKLHLT